VKKIALIGSAPSSVALAPYADNSWEIWGCSPGARPHVKRADAWFELHRWNRSDPWFSPEYVQFMAEMAKPVYMITPVPDIPGSVAYPAKDMVDEFGPFFFTSSLAWMFALAIKAGADEIGLWGVDMSAQEEWQWQRQGCQFFIWLAKKMGITVTIPPESDLMRPPPLYGFCEVDPMHVKIQARKAELNQRYNEAIARAQNSQREADFIRGALDDQEYVAKTWISDHHAVQHAYRQPEGGRQIDLQPPPPMMNGHDTEYRVDSLSNADVSARA